MQENIEKNLKLFPELVLRFNDFLSDKYKCYQKKNAKDFMNYSKSIKYFKRFLEQLTKEEKDCIFFVIQIQHFLTKEVLIEVLGEPEEKIPLFETVEDLFPNLTVDQLEKVQKWIDFLKIDFSHNTDIFRNLSNIYIPKPSAPNPPPPPPEPEPQTPPPPVTNTRGVPGWSANPRPPNPNSYRHAPHIRVSSTVPHQPPRPAPVMRNNNDRVRSLAELKAILGEK